MPKLSRNSLGVYNKSGGAPHQESRKTESAIFRIFYDFLENLQDSAIWLYYWSYSFAAGSLELFNPHRYTLTLHRTPRTGLGACNWVPRPDRRRGRLEFGKAGGALGRGIGGKGPVAHLGSVRAQSWGRGCPSDGARRWPSVPTAAAWGSGEGVHGWAMCDLGRCYGS
jgi:hypothetical protein